MVPSKGAPELLTVSMVDVTVTIIAVGLPEARRVQTGTRSRGDGTTPWRPGREQSRYKDTSRRFTCSCVRAD